MGLDWPFSFLCSNGSSGDITLIKPWMDSIKDVSYETNKFVVYIWTKINLVKLCSLADDPA